MVKYAENLNEFFLAFDPDALRGEELDEFYYNATMPIRMNDAYKSPMEDIYRACQAVRTQNAHLLLGHRGCGKSTELNALKQKLEEDGRKVSVIQCLLEADRMNIVYWDLLILLGQHLCKLAQKAGCGLPDALLDCIEDFWKETEIIETVNDECNFAIKGEISVSTPKIVKLLQVFAGLSSELQFGQSKREVIRDKVRKSAAQWIGYMKEVSDYITTHLDGKQPILIFEDLDKLTPEKAWEIFDNPLSQMPFPVIYTFPISLSYDPRFAGLEASFNNIHVLPMIKIRTLEGDRFEAGIDAIRAIVGKRADLSLFYESDDESALDLFISPLA